MSILGKDILGFALALLFVSIRYRCVTRFGWFGIGVRNRLPVSGLVLALSGASKWCVVFSIVPINNRV